MNEERILYIMWKANKLGAEGIEVIGYTTPDSASSNDQVCLIVQYPAQNLKEV